MIQLLQARCLIQEKLRQLLLLSWLLKPIALTAFCLLPILNAYSQDAKTYYEQGLEKENAQQYKEALPLFDKAIELKPDDNVVWCERGYCKNNLMMFTEAIADFNRSLQLDSGYKRAWLNRGVARFRLDDYNGSLSDFDHAIAIDSQYAKAYYARGITNEKMGNADAACKDYSAAYGLGITTLQDKVDKCNGTTKKTVPQPGFIVLDADGKNEKLQATPPQQIVAGKDTSWNMVFFLMPSRVSSTINGSFNEPLITDSLSSVEIVLQNGQQLHLDNTAHSRHTSKNSMVLFMVIFNLGQRQMLLENNIQKISFLTADKQREYSIKWKYAGNMREVF